MCGAQRPYWISRARRARLVRECNASQLTPRCEHRPGMGTRNGEREKEEERGLARYRHRLIYRPRYPSIHLQELGLQKSIAMSLSLRLPEPLADDARHTRARTRVRFPCRRASPSLTTDAPRLPTHYEYGTSNPPSESRHPAPMDEPKAVLYSNARCLLLCPSGSVTRWSAFAHRHSIKAAPGPCSSCHPAHHIPPMATWMPGTSGRQTTKKQRRVGKRERGARSPAPKINPLGPDGRTEQVVVLELHSHTPDHVAWAIIATGGHTRASPWSMDLQPLFLFPLPPSRAADSGRTRRAAAALRRVLFNYSLV